MQLFIMSNHLFCRPDCSKPMANVVHDRILQGCDLEIFYSGQNACRGQEYKLEGAQAHSRSAFMQIVDFIFLHRIHSSPREPGILA